MHQATVKIRGVAPYCQSKFHGEPKLNKEGSDAYERRTWSKKAHVNSDGNIVIPALALKNVASEIAKFLGMQIPGKGKSTYTKHFESGVLVFDDCVIDGVKIDNGRVREQQMFVPADGRRGGGTRVMRSFPVIDPPWTTTVEYTIMDDVITEEVFKTHLQQAGQLIGLGAFRVRNNGIWGRFQVESMTWRAVDSLIAS